VWEGRKGTRMLEGREGRGLEVGELEEWEKKGYESKRDVDARW